MLVSSNGGSSKLKVYRDRQSRQTKEEKKEKAKQRAVEKYGAVFISGLQQHWSFLNLRYIQKTRHFLNFMGFRGSRLAFIRQNTAYFYDLGRFWVAGNWASEIN